MKVAVKRDYEAVRISLFPFKPYHPAKALLVSEHESKRDAQRRHNEELQHREELPYVCIPRCPVVRWNVVLINNVIPSCRGIWMVKDSRRATLIRSRVN